MVQHTSVPAMPVPAATAFSLSALPPQSPCSRQTSAASSKMRGFPILTVSDPSARVRGRSAARSRLSSLPHALPQEQGGSCFGRDRGHGKRDRKRRPGPLSLWERMTGDIGEGRGRTPVSPHAWTPLPPVEQGDSQAVGNVEPAELGSCTNTEYVITSTPEAWAGAQGWLSTGHPSMHKQPLLLRQCAHLPRPRLPPPLP